MSRDESMVTALSNDSLYESHAQKLKDLAKENPGKETENGAAAAPKEHKRRLFAYSFELMDLKTRMYIAFGSSMKS